MTETCCSQKPGIGAQGRSRYPSNLLQHVLRKWDSKAMLTEFEISGLVHC